MKRYVIFFETAPDFWEYESFSLYADAMMRAAQLSKQLGIEILIYSYEGKVYFKDFKEFSDEEEL